MFVCDFVCVVSVPISVRLWVSLSFLFPEIFWVSGLETGLFRRNVPDSFSGWATSLTHSLSVNEFYHLTKIQPRVGTEILTKR